MEQVWRDLLIGASDDPEERYLLKLIQQGSKVSCTLWKEYDRWMKI